MDEANHWVAFRDSAIHGCGGFARRAIPAGTLVIEYVGRRIDKAESLRQCELENPFIFTLDETCDLDGNVDWNPARHINHSCAPNCEAENLDGKIWLVALRAIPAGEELTFNYGFDLVDYQDHPCHCGSPDCVGFMVAAEYFDLLRRRAG